MSHDEQKPVSASGADDLDCKDLDVGSLSISAVEAYKKFHDPKPLEASEISKLILTHKCPELIELNDLRPKGWENADGDKVFGEGRQKTANPDYSNKETFDYLKMMEDIAWETHYSTTCFKIQKKASPRPQILDMGMAPGGFLSIALKHNREAQAFGFSLPVSDGGYEILVKKRPDVVIKELDVTMLAADLGIDDMPEKSPDGRPFLSRQFAPGQKFDLVICGGSVVRDHPVLIVREGCRLRASQLALGLQRLSPGGRMVVLFHKLEEWDTVLDLYRFSRFSDKVQLCKPPGGPGHDKRSSFYMVATGVHSDYPEALDAIKSWKALWKAATLGVDGKLMKVVRDDEPAVEKVLKDFGDKLKDMGKEIWRTQAQALKEAPCIKNIKK